jgi:hypothetical protein
MRQSRLWVRRLKNGLSVEQPVAGDELRAIKRYLATRADKLPWLFISERGQPLTRQSVNYLVAGAARARACLLFGRICCGIRAASIVPIGATTCASSRIILGIATRSTLSATPGPR